MSETEAPVIREAMMQDEKEPRQQKAIAGPASASQLERHQGGHHPDWPVLLVSEGSQML